MSEQPTQEILVKVDALAKRVLLWASAITATIVLWRTLTPPGEIVVPALYLIWSLIYLALTLSAHSVGKSISTPLIAAMSIVACLFMSTLSLTAYMVSLLADSVEAGVASGAFSADRINLYGAISLAAASVTWAAVLVITLIRVVPRYRLGPE